MKVATESQPLLSDINSSEAAVRPPLVFRWPVKRIQFQEGLQMQNPRVESSPRLDIDRHCAAICASAALSAAAVFIGACSEQPSPGHNSSQAL